MSSVKDGSEQSKASSTTFQKVKLTKREKLMIFARIGLMIFFEIVLPIILYYVLKNFIPEIWALIISGVPPFLVVVYGIIAKRRIDILGVIIIISFIVSAIVSSLKNDTRIYLLRESAITGTVGLTFLLTLIPIKFGTFQMRPIIYYFAKDMQTGGSFGYTPTKRSNTDSTDDVTERWERYWDKYAVFRHGFYFLTVLWGVGLLAEVPIRAIIVFKAPTTDRAVLLTNIVTYSWLGALILSNSLYSRYFRKRCIKEITEAEQNEQAALNQSNQTPV